MTGATGGTPARAHIFPLNTVLFPGGMLPLKIFEQRYLDMVMDALAAHKCFVINLRNVPYMDSTSIGTLMSATAVSACDSTSILGSMRTATGCPTLGRNGCYIKLAADPAPRGGT